MMDHNRGTPLEVVYSTDGSEILGWVCPACHQFINGAVEHVCPIARNVELYHKLDRIIGLLEHILMNMRS